MAGQADVKKELFEVFEEEKREISSIKKRFNKLCERYGLEDAQLLYLIRKDWECQYVPVEIFSQKLSPLEAVVCYMRRNLGLGISRISALLNRDSRAVWATYRNSLKKQRLLKLPIESSALIPVSILGNRNFSILEAVSAYLRQRKGMRLTRIAGLLNKSTSTIGTALSRAGKKGMILRKNSDKRGGMAG